MVTLYLSLKFDFVKFNLQKLGDKLLKALNFLTKDFDQGNNSIILNGKNIEDFSTFL